MAVLDPDIEVGHRVWQATGPRGAGRLLDPVTRYVYSVAPMNAARGPRTDPIDIDAIARTISDVLLDTAEPEVYSKLDTVLIRGISYEIQGQPEAMDFGSQMPFSEYDDMFGALVHARRVE